MNDKHRNMLDELLADDSDKMNKWEIGFIEGIDKRDPYLSLSVGQIHILEEIWAKVFGGS